MAETLLLGQVAASGPGAELWYLAEDTYGRQASIGTEKFLFLEDQPRAPVGRAGYLELRRVYVPFAYNARCTIKVTPVVDFDWLQPPTVVSFATPNSRKVAVIEAESAAAGTYVSSRVEVVDYDGRVEVFTPDYAWVSKAAALPAAVAGAD